MFRRRLRSFQRGPRGHWGRATVGGEVTDVGRRRDDSRVGGVVPCVMSFPNPSTTGRGQDARTRLCGSSEVSIASPQFAGTLMLQVVTVSYRDKHMSDVSHASHHSKRVWQASQLEYRFNRRDSHISVYARGAVRGTFESSASEAQQLRNFQAELPLRVDHPSKRQIQAIELT